MSIIIESDKFHFDTKAVNASGLFSTWRAVLFPADNIRFSKYGDRPAFPVIHANPNVNQVLSNLNKGDVFFYFTFMPVYFLVSYASLRSVGSIAGKLHFMRAFMHLGNVGTLLLIGNCSAFRLKGTHDNGLRWKYKDQRFNNKYDLTSEYEKGTIFERLRNRI